LIANCSKEFGHHDSFAKRPNDSSIWPGPDL
jgi:hypothetical protein